MFKVFIEAVVHLRRLSSSAGLVSQAIKRSKTRGHLTEFSGLRDDF